MGVPVALLAGQRHSMLELHPKQSEVDALTAKRMNAGQGSGPAVGWNEPYVGHHFKNKAAWSRREGRLPESMQ